MRVNTPQGPGKSPVKPVRRPRLKDYNRTYLVSDPKITTSDLDALQQHALPPDHKWQALRIRTSRNDENFVVISWRGDLTHYEADLIISPSRMGYLIFAHDAVRFQDSDSYLYTLCQTMADVCKVVRNYIDYEMNSNVTTH